MNPESCIKSNGVGDIVIVKTENATKTSIELFTTFYADGSVDYEEAVFDFDERHVTQINYADYLLAYKKRDFDVIKMTNRRRCATEKSFRRLLNEYIVDFIRKPLCERKNIYFDITFRGQFVAIKKIGNEEIRCDLSASEKTLFDFLCFLEINEFWQTVNGVRDLNYEDKPLILINFAKWIDECFDYAAFLREHSPHRKIFVIIETIGE